MFFIIFNINIVSASIQKEATETFDVTHDAYVDSRNPDFNYKSDYLDVNYYELFSSNEEKISYLGFVVDLPNNITIISIELILEVFIKPSHSVPINIWETSIFNEDTLTYNNAPILNQIISIVNINEDKVWDISLNKDLLGKKQSYYFAIETDIDSISTLYFNSKENNFLGDPPRLRIIYDDPNITDFPIPNSFLGIIVLGAVILGVVGLVYLGKQKQRKKELSKQVIKHSQGFCGNCGKIKEIRLTNCRYCGEKY